MLKIYLAGPSVFHDDAVERGAAMKEICAQYGFQGLHPMDKPVYPGTKQEVATQIYIGNTKLLDEADIIVADVNHFRGHEPDSGTAFEIGYGAAQGKPVYVYLSDGSEIVDRSTAYRKNDKCYDEWDMIVEDFGMPVNLMIGISSKIVIGTFEDCMKAVKTNHG